MDQENSFQWGIFIFLAAGKLTFWGGITSKLASNKLAAPRKGFDLATFFSEYIQYNKRLLRQKTGGACLYMPQDGH